MWRPIEGADDRELSQLLAASHPIRVRAELWRGTDYLGSAPLVGGQLTEKGDQLVEGTLDLDVARIDPKTGASWVPDEPLDPLNIYGQRVRLSYDVGRADGSWLTCGLGWFIVDEWELDGDVVTVSALDVMDAVRTARLLAPLAPKSSGTFASELRRLIGGRVPVDLSDAPADRAVPSGMSWDEDRLGAVDELLNAWPARAELDSDGVLVVLPDDLDEQPADVQLVEGSGGVIIRRRRAGSREGLANVVVARGDQLADATAPAVVGYAADLTPSSPTYVEGPMGELVRYFASPLLRTTGQANAAARTILRRSLRPANVIPVELLPDPRIGVNTRVQLVRATGETTEHIVTSAALPLTGAGGAMSIELGGLVNA